MAGPPESVFDWTKEFDADFPNQNSNNQAFSRKYWRLLQCQNGMLIYLIYVNLWSKDLAEVGGGGDCMNQSRS